MAKKGRFIAIEGGDGSGKDTAIEFLRPRLAGLDVLYAREPAGDPVSAGIKALVQDPAMDIAPRADILLFCAARAENLAKTIIPALLRGADVIVNRFDLSTLAYQVYGREHLELLDFTLELNRAIAGDFVPDSYIFLDVPPDVVLERIRASKPTPSRFEVKDAGFRARVREGFLKHLPKEPRGFRVDGARPIEEVGSEVLGIIERMLE